jgi:protein TonB
MNTRMIVSACIVLLLCAAAQLAAQDNAPAADSAALLPGAPAVSTQFDLPPTVLKRVMPVYPEEAKADNLEGIVYVQIRVGTDGSVKDAKIAKSEQPVFNQSALDAVRQWTFVPAQKDGAAVDVSVTLPLRYRLATDGGK